MMYNEKRWLNAIFLVAFSVATNATQIEFRGKEVEPTASDYNFKVGDLALDLRYTFGVVYDDNTNRSNTRSNREEGTKIGNALTINVDWPLNPHMHIQSGITAGYVFFVEGEGTDGFIISGTDGDIDGKISFDLRLGQAGQLTLEENLSRSIDSVEVDRVDNSEDFSLWHNTLSLQYENQLSRFLNFAGKAAWRETWSADSDFDFRDKTALILESILLAQINSLLQAGPFVHYIHGKYDNRDRAGFRHNDTDDFEIGLNMRYQISAGTLATLSIGYQEFFVDEDNSSTPAGIPVINDEDDGVTVEFNLYDELSEFIRHRLFVSYRRNAGTSPSINFSEDILTTYNVIWEFIRDWELIGQFTWLKTNESGDGEIADIFITLAGMRYNISPKSHMSLDYRRSEKFSNSRGRDYERNEIRFLFGYDF